MEFNKVLGTNAVNADEINYLFIYHPKSKGIQDSISEEILILKDLNHKIPFNEEIKDLVNKFAGTFVKYFIRKIGSNVKDYTFCTVPSHKAGTDNKNGVYIFSRWCRIIRDSFDKDVLIRHTDIDSLHSGGDRAVGVHLESIKVNKTVKGKKIVLMDDVTTTGNSLLACKQLLMEAGAKEVIMFSFAKTFSWID